MRTPAAGAARPGGRRRAGPRGVALGLALVLGAAGCAPGYVLRAGYEEARILWRRQPIETLLAGELDADTRAKLELTLAVRAFARDRLGLSVGGSYTSLARVDEDQVVHLVTAAPRDRLEPYTWWFPIVGRVPYRSYFDPAAARALARALERDGYDTYVRPAVAFSTLGWFDDPLLSNLLRYDQVSLASVIIHELLHGTVYLPGQAAFNESFGAFVGYRGAMAFFASRGDAARGTQAARLWEDALAFSAFLGRLVVRLEAAYAAGIDPAGREALFRAAQAEFRGRPRQTGLYEDFGQVALNNAIIVHHWLYADRLDLFEEAFAQAGADLAAAIARVRQAAAEGPDPFAALERALRAAAPGREAARAAAGYDSIASSRRSP